MEAITGKKIVPTFFCGSKPIDAVWVSPDLVVTSVCVLPIGYGVGDHQMSVLDITNCTMVGADHPTIQRPPHQQLTTKSPQTVERYNYLLEQQLISYSCLECLHDIYQQPHQPHNSDTQLRLCCLDNEVSDYMRHAKKNSRKIKNGTIPYSLEVVIWI